MNPSVGTPPWSPGSRPRRQFDPAILPRLALFIPVFAVLSATAADPDLWGHVRFGSDIVAARAIPEYDAYSFTSDRVWVNHEWLSEVIFYAAYAAGGNTGLIALRLAILALTLLIIARALDRAELPAIARDLLLVFAVVGTMATTGTVRPQLFSLLAFTWLLWRLRESERCGWHALLLVPLVMAIWANLHGGWLVGLGALGLWTMATIARRGSSANSNAPSRPQLVAILAASAFATALNPYGAGLWRFLGETVSVTRADIVEWRPITTAPPAEIGIWIVTCVAAALAIAKARQRLVSPGAFAVVMLLALGSLRVRRLDAFLVLAVVILAGPALVAAFGRRARGLKPPRYAGPVERTLQRARPPAWVIVALVLAAVIVDGRMRPSGRFGCIDTSDPRLPDGQAAAFIRANAVSGRMLTWFDWGEYAIWHFSPRVQVSMDGRRETVYSDSLIRAHLGFYFDDPGGLVLVKQLNPGYIWLPADLPAVRVLEAEGWRRVFGGQRSVLFQRSGSGRQTATQPTAPVNRCFPG